MRNLSGFRYFEKKIHVSQQTLSIKIFHPNDKQRCFDMFKSVLHYSVFNIFCNKLKEKK